MALIGKDGGPQDSSAININQQEDHQRYQRARRDSDSDTSSDDSQEGGGANMNFFKPALDVGSDFIKCSLLGNKDEESDYHPI